MKYVSKLVCLGILIIQSIPMFAFSEDVIQLEGISIMGSTEDSRILTIAGWHDVDSGELIAFKPLESIQGRELFEAIHPHSFKLDVKYADRLRTNAGNLLKESN